MVVKFYSFSKRPKSSKVPQAGYSGEVILNNVVLKEECSIISPILRVAWTGQSGSPVSKTYCIIPDFGRNYFITDWIYVNKGLWEATLELDLLGTYRENIKGSNLYVDRRIKR